MQQLFIELYNYKPSWQECSQSERVGFVEKVIEAVEALQSVGVDIVGYGANSVATDHRASYDFFCVYRVPSAAFQRIFERQISASGWYAYFDQVSVSGDVKDFRKALLDNAELVRPEGLDRMLN